MQQIEFSTEELNVLREVLHHSINEMDVEVLHTDTHHFKEMLKRRRALLDLVLQRIETAAPVAA